VERREATRLRKARPSKPVRAETGPRGGAFRRSTPSHVERGQEVKARRRFGARQRSRSAGEFWMRGGGGV